MKVIIISGPTASGKTGLSIDLATRFGGEIVNFDSLLLYREINIGTAKPTPEEQKNIPHHMINVASVAAPMNAADYARMALPKVEKILEANKLVFLVGGSGFYLQALLKGMYESPTTPVEIQQRSEETYAKSGIRAFREILKDNDPASYQLYHENDHYRIRRAVEHFWATGRAFSLERLKKDTSNSHLNRPTIHAWDILHLHLDMPKDEHLNLINQRTQQMLQNGLFHEVDHLISMGFTGEERPLQSIGYKEVFDLKAGILSDENACQERIIISTRQLAKSQRTWFKKIPDKQIFHPKSDRDKIYQTVGSFISKG
jgi:tRNA dimethylallyltransferase